MPYVVSRAAQRQIDAIWLHIAQDSVDAAQDWLGKLEDKFLFLNQNPGAGRFLNDFLPLSVQVWPCGDYLVFYRATVKGVGIRAVVHGARDWPVLLRAGRL